MDDPKEKTKSWFKERGETLAIIAAIVAGVWTIKGDIHAIDQRLGDKINECDNRLTAIETVLKMSGMHALSFSEEKKLKQE